MRITNPDAEFSCCRKCSRAKDGCCWLTKKKPKPLAQAQLEHRRCMYFDEVM